MVHVAVTVEQVTLQGRPRFLERNGLINKKVCFHTHTHTYSLLVSCLLRIRFIKSVTVVPVREREG